MVEVALRSSCMILTFMLFLMMSLADSIVCHDYVLALSRRAGKHGGLARVSDQGR